MNSNKITILLFIVLTSIYAQSAGSNPGEKVFDLSTRENSDIITFHTPIDKVTLYHGDSLNTGTLTSSSGSQNRVVSINFQLYVFTKDSTIPNETSFNVVFKINEIETAFEKHYDIINYPVSEQFFNSDGITYSIISFNYIHTHFERIDTLSLDIANSDPSKYKGFAKYAYLYTFACHPACKNCDMNDFKCIECYSENSSLANNCECPSNLPFANLKDNNYHIDCPREINKELLCEKYGLINNYFTSCAQCNGSAYKTYDNFINPVCECKIGTLWTEKDEFTKDCLSRLDQFCSNYDEARVVDLKHITNWALTENNIKIDISDEKEPIYDEVYYNLKLSYISLTAVSPNPPASGAPTPEHISSGWSFDKDVAIKISIRKGEHEISNILSENGWLNNFTEGININKHDLNADKYDCTSNKISNGALVYTCNIKIYVFHPCKSFIYMSAEAKVKIGVGGVIESNISIDANGTSKVDIPCLNNNQCFFNEKFSTHIMVCEKIPCLQSRSSPFAPGDTLNIKPILSVTDGNPDKYSQSIESAVFYIKNTRGEVTGKFDVTNEAKSSIENGKKIFGFIIPAASSLMSKSGYLEGANVSFSIILRVDGERRILQANAQNGYSLIPPLNIKIEIDPEYLQGGNKYSDIITDNKVNTLIIIFTCIICTLLVFIVLYCLIKNRLNKKSEHNVIVYEKPIKQVDKDTYSSHKSCNIIVEDIEIKI